MKFSFFTLFFTGSLLGDQDNISEASIQTALQSMAAIKTKLYDSNANLFPQVVAIRKTADGCSVIDILNDIEPSNKSRILTKSQLQQQQQDNRTTPQQQQQQQQQDNRTTPQQRRSN